MIPTAQPALPDFSFVPGWRPAAPLTVLVDIKSPYAFVAIAPTLALEREAGISFNWLPLTLDIPSYLGSARKRKGKVVSNQRSPAAWAAVKYAYADARRYAERQGHCLLGTEKIWDSSLAAIGLLWLLPRRRSALADYFGAVYPPFWRRELDIEDPAVVSGCLASAGVDTAGFEAFAAGEGRALHDRLQALYHPAGLYGVPTYVFDDIALFGREHLPWVRWRLGGKVGAAPDVANPL